MFKFVPAGLPASRPAAYDPEHVQLRRAPAGNRSPAAQHGSASPPGTVLVLLRRPGLPAAPPGPARRTGPGRPGRRGGRKHVHVTAGAGQTGYAARTNAAAWRGSLGSPSPRVPLAANATGIWPSFRPPELAVTHSNQTQSNDLVVSAPFRIRVGRRRLARVASNAQNISLWPYRQRGLHRAPANTAWSLVLPPSGGAMGAKRCRARSGTTAMRGQPTRSESLCINFSSSALI
jgi:hypothetical protein